jgi:ARG and Rhodanese-Phosphatase-superfamily-associated Protein domain
MIPAKMVSRTGLLIIGISLLICSLAAQNRHSPKTDPLSDPAVQMITGPYSHENLSVFLLHGKDQLPGKHYLTLGEALAQKKVMVYETSQVNELMVENFSDEEIYIQSGDIVKGGKQDRTIGYDLILPPHSGKMRIASFCVEHGRWQARGNEKAAEFNSSEQRLAGKQLKIAAIQKNDQSEVWRNVTRMQDKLSANLGTTVNAPQSASSLQLSLENEKVKETVDDYLRILLPIVEKKRDVIGFAFAINGVVNSADVYSTHELFLKMWPKLLKSSAIEAIAELTRDRSFKPATPAMVSASIKDAEKGKHSQKVVSSRVKIVTSETEQNLLFETRDQSKNEQWIHKSYIQK